MSILAVMLFVDTYIEYGLQARSNRIVVVATTMPDWSFVVSLKFDTIEGQTYNRICFNVLL